MATTPFQTNVQTIRAASISKAFSRTTSVSVSINATPDIVWALLTNASDFARWNSTIVSMEGNIEHNGKVKLKSTLDKKRTFELKVKVPATGEKMVWINGAAPFFRGVRTLLLEKQTDGTTLFCMTETLSGLMYPLAASSIPDFKESFEQYASDLRKEAELISNIK